MSSVRDDEVRIRVDIRALNVFQEDVVIEATVVHEIDTIQVVDIFREKKVSAVRVIYD